MSDGTIVVGVDGSESSQDALRWAAKQAQLTKAHLRVIMSWEIPRYAYMASVPVDINWEEDCGNLLRKTVADALGTSPQIDMTTSVIQGHPAPVLVDASKDADLLVVGSRGHGAFTGMLLGSVSEHCVSHAHCPVVVLRSKS